MQKLEDAFAKISKIKNQISVLSERDISRSSVKKKLLSDLKEKENNLMLEYASDPDLFIHMKCWYVEIFGTSELTEEDLANLKYDGNRVLIPPDNIELDEYTSEILTKASGNIGFSIRSSLIEDDFHQFSIRLINRLWGIGLHLTTSEADRLCQLLYGKFDKAIKAGIFKIVRKPWYLEFDLD